MSNINRNFSDHGTHFICCGKGKIDAIRNVIEFCITSNPKGRYTTKDGYGGYIYFYISTHVHVRIRKQVANILGYEGSIYSKNEIDRMIRRDERRIKAGKFIPKHNSEVVC